MRRTRPARFGSGPVFSGASPISRPLQGFDHLHEHYAHQTPLNILALLDGFELWGGRPLPEGFRQAPAAPGRRENRSTPGSPLFPEGRREPVWGKTVRREIERVLEPRSPPLRRSGGVGYRRLRGPESMTFAETATRAFEESFWNDISFLSHGRTSIRTTPTASRTR